VYNFKKNFFHVFSFKYCIEVILHCCSSVMPV